MQVRSKEIGILLPNNLRQHRTLHIQKDVLLYALCYLLCSVTAAINQQSVQGHLAHEKQSSS